MTLSSNKIRSSKIEGLIDILIFAMISLISLPFGDDRWGFTPVLLPPCYFSTSGNL